MNRTLILASVLTLASSSSSALESTATDNSAIQNNLTTSKLLEAEVGKLQKTLDSIAACHADTKIYAPNYPDADSNGCHAPPKNDQDINKLRMSNVAGPTMRSSNVYLNYDPTTADRACFEAGYAGMKSYSRGVLLGTKRLATYTGASWTEKDTSGLTYNISSLTCLRFYFAD